MMMDSFTVNMEVKRLKGRHQGWHELSLSNDACWYCFLTVTTSWIATGKA